MSDDWGLSSSTVEFRQAERDAANGRDGGSAAAERYRLWVSADRCTLVRMWPSGVVEVATRKTPAHTWGPPVQLAEEKT